MKDTAELTSRKHCSNRALSLSRLPNGELNARVKEERVLTGSSVPLCLAEPCSSTQGLHGQTRCVPYVIEE